MEVAMKDGSLHLDGCGDRLRVQDGQDPCPPRRDGGGGHGNVRGGVIIVLAGDGAAARDVAEHLAPAAVVVQVLLKIVVVVVGVEDVLDLMLGSPRLSASTTHSSE